MTFFFHWLFRLLFSPLSLSYIAYIMFIIFSSLHANMYMCTSCQQILTQHVCYIHFNFCAYCKPLFQLLLTCNIAGLLLYLCIRQPFCFTFPVSMSTSWWFYMSCIWFWLSMLSVSFRTPNIFHLEFSFPLPFYYFVFLFVHSPVKLKSKFPRSIKILNEYSYLHIWYIVLDYFVFLIK